MIFTGTSFIKLIMIMLIPMLNLADWADRLKWLFLAFPHYALGNSFLNMNEIRINSKVCHFKRERYENISSSTDTPILHQKNKELNSTVIGNFTYDSTMCGE